MSLSVEGHELLSSSGWSSWYAVFCVDRGGGGGGAPKRPRPAAAAA
jgi:hypothetical protein